jgi:hypothetical protein
MEEPLHCLVETPKGSRNKPECDGALGAIKLDRFLCGLQELGDLPDRRLIEQSRARREERAS